MTFIPQKILQNAKYSMILLFSEKARPLRFILTGGACGILQLGLLAVLTLLDWKPILANTIAFLLAAQVNFALCIVFTWHDRSSSTGKARITLFQRWLRFHVSIAGTALLNQGVFVIAQTILPILPASGLGIGITAIANFMLGDRLVFRNRNITLIKVVSMNNNDGKDI